MSENSKGNISLLVTVIHMHAVRKLLHSVIWLDLEPNVVCEMSFTFNGKMEKDDKGPYSQPLCRRVEKS